MFLYRSLGPGDYEDGSHIETMIEDALNVDIIGREGETK